MDEEGENEVDSATSEQESTSTDDAVNYKICLLYEKDKKCGPFTQDRSIKEGLVKIGDIDADIWEHYTNLRFKDFFENLKWSERDLVENRAGKFLDDSSLICEYHRNSLGLNWIPGHQCIHPLHSVLGRGKKAAPTKLAPLWIVKKLNKENLFSFILGGRLCDKHRRMELQNRMNEEEFLLEPSVDELDQEEA